MILRALQRLHYDTIASTQTEALRLIAEEGAERLPMVLTATRQTGGIGRSGRPWWSPDGGLWLTLVWPMAQLREDLHALPLAVGLSLSTVLESALGVRSQIKWPNDVLVDGRKVAGVLCQSQQATDGMHVLVGIGVNGNFRCGDLPPDLRMPATTLEEALGRPVNLPLLQDQLLQTLCEALGRFEVEGFSPLRSEFQSRLAWLDQEITFSIEGAPRRGILRGVDGLGRLSLETQTGLEFFLSGEIEAASLSDDQSADVPYY